MNGEVHGNFIDMEYITPKETNRRTGIIQNLCAHSWLNLFLQIPMFEDTDRRHQHHDQINNRVADHHHTGGGDRAKG